jgi:methyl-accepting chemotaxis protein
MKGEFSIQRLERFAGKRIPAVLRAVKENGKRLLAGKTSPISGIPASLSALRGSLISMNQRVEPRFLQIGEDLQTVCSDASGVADETVEAVGLIGGGSGQGILTSINSLANGSLEELETCKEQVSGSLDRVKAVIGNLDKLVRLCGVAEKITMVLNVVGFNIDVESSRSEKSREMFGVVAQEIRAFTEKVLGIDRKIHEDATSARVLQTSAFKEISHGIGELWKLADEVGTTVDAAVKKIEDLMGFVLGSMEQAERSSREISRQVSEIVVAIQFQDSMRQRIDHVEESLRDVEVLCGKNGKGENRDGDTAGDLRSACSTLQVQKAQLREVASEVEAVYQKCRKAFGGIVSEVDRLASSLSRLEAGDGVASSRGRTPFSSLAAALDDLNGILKRGRGLVDSVQKGANHASATGARLADYTEQIHQISLKTHIMALNSIVKAAHLGEDGTTLEILAHEVGSLSMQSSAFVSDMTAVLADLGLSAGDLKGQDPQGKEVRFDDINQALAGTYEEFKKRASDSLSRAGNIGTAVSKIQEALGFLPALRGEVDDRIRELEGIIQILAPWTGSSASLKEGKRAVEDRYTMQEERDVHERIMKAGGGSSGEDVGRGDDGKNNIAFFPRDNSDTETGSTGNAGLFAEGLGPVEASMKRDFESPGAETGSEEGDLGDNVELF